VQLNPQDPVASAIVARIDELFAIDAEPRCQALSLEARNALRREQSRPLLDGIRKQIEAARSTVLPGGALAKACNYTLTLWQKLTRFLEYPELELSNNLGGEFDASHTLAGHARPPELRTRRGLINRQERSSGLALRDGLQAAGACGMFGRGRR
jgi:hypothetical protein